MNEEKESGQKGGGRWGWILIVVIVVAITVGIYFAFRPKGRRNKGGSFSSTETDYNNALRLAMSFFDIQKAGELENNKIRWRGDSALNDGSDAKLNLSKGLYDAGDHMKFGFPMAFTATILSWAIHHYRETMISLKQLDAAEGNLRWITDYLINAHPNETILYVQVGDPDLDHKCWDRPETMSDIRPLRRVDTTKSGSDVAAETAAAMAAASMVFKESDSNYSDTLISHAQELFGFADKYRGCYSSSIPSVVKYYNSSGYGDELLWAATWLFCATKNDTYLEFINDNGDEFANFGQTTWFSWDSKHAGVQVLVSWISGANEKYRQTAETFMCSLIKGSPSEVDTKTKDGTLIWVSEWNSLMHPIGAAFLALYYSDCMLTFKYPKIDCKGKTYKASDLREFAVSQAEYVLGKNDARLSYLVGYGDEYPEFVHHRGASIPADSNSSCDDGFKWLTSPKPNPNVCTGAVVGGPFQNDTYNDIRNNSMQGEPTTYNCALFVALISGLIKEPNPKDLGFP